MMKRTDRPHDEAMAELYADDPDFAIEVINSILEDGDQAELLIMLRQLSQAFGDPVAVAEKARLNSTQVYRTFSERGNPTLANLRELLDAMNLRLMVANKFS